MQEYPKMLYKNDGLVEIDGNFYQTKVVKDKTEEENYLSDGWKHKPVQGEGLEEKYKLQKENEELKRKLEEAQKVNQESSESKVSKETIEHIEQVNEYIPALEDGTNQESEQEPEEEEQEYKENFFEEPEQEKKSIDQEEYTEETVVQLNEFVSEQEPEQENKEPKRRGRKKGK